MSQAPTAVRWRIVGLLLGYSALVHFNRGFWERAGKRVAFTGDAGFQAPSDVLHRC